MSDIANILVVEDNEWNMELITAIIESAGHTVTAVGTGAEALEALSSQKFAAVALDVSLPDIDGFQVASKIRQDPLNANLPILAVTAHALQRTREEAMAVGCNAFVTKPVDRIDFLSELSRCLESSDYKQAS